MRRQMVGGASAVTVYVQDVSAGGIGLLSPSPVRPYSILSLELSNGCGEVLLRCSVRHCAAVAPGLYSVGADMLAFEARPALPPAEAGDASAAWAGFFAAEAGEGAE